MAAILGKLTQSVESLCEQARRNSGVVVPANYNTEEQIVVSGEVSGVERVMQLAKECEFVEARGLHQGPIIPS